MTESFAQMFEESLASQKIKPGAILMGRVVDVGPDVVLGDRVELIGHVTVMGATTLGAEVRTQDEDGYLLAPVAAL